MQCTSALICPVLRCKHSIFRCCKVISLHKTSIFLVGCTFFDQMFMFIPVDQLCLCNMAARLVIIIIIFFFYHMHDLKWGRKPLYIFNNINFVSTWSKLIEHAFIHPLSLSLRGLIYCLILCHWCSLKCTCSRFMLYYQCLFKPAVALSFTM